MADIQGVDVDGSQNEYCSVYRVEVETEDNTYFFAFESSFYNCRKKEDKEIVEPGTDSRLEEMDEESVKQFCKEKAEEYENSFSREAV